MRGEKKREFVETVKGIILEVTGLTEEELEGRSKSRTISRARQYFCMVMRDAGFSLMAIGAEIGDGRDHSSVVNLLNRLNDTINTDQEIKAQFNEVQSRIANMTTLNNGTHLGVVYRLKEAFRVNQASLNYILTPADILAA